MKHPKFTKLQELNLLMEHATILGPDGATGMPVHAMPREIRIHPRKFMYADDDDRMLLQVLADLYHDDSAEFTYGGKDERLEALWKVHPAFVKGRESMLMIVPADMFAKAAECAVVWHDGQERKYTDVPYAAHPIAVACSVARAFTDGSIDFDVKDKPANIVVAAFLHDILEDTDKTEEDIRLLFNDEVVRLVKEVTNPSRNMSRDIPRKERKKVDFDHVAEASHGGKIIKIEDRINNLLDTAPYSPDIRKFLTKYAAETEDLLTRFEGFPWKNGIERLKFSVDVCRARIAFFADPANAKAIEEWEDRSSED